MSWSQLLTPLNLLTLSRVPLAAAFLAVESVYARAALVGVASVTDVLDGWLARRLGRATPLGALLDPVADKTFVLAALSVFIMRGELSARDYFIILSRDLATAVGFLVAWRLPGLNPAKFRARWLGKVVTALQVLALLALLLAPATMRVLIPLIAVASAAAIADYTLTLHRARART